MDAKLQAYIDKLNALNFKEMYNGDFFLTWEKSDDELEAVFTVADALRYMREHGRLNEENIFEKLAAHARVDDRARAGDVVQRHFTLEDDENARARFGHFRAGEHRLRDGVFNGRDLLRAREGVERAPAARAELIDEAADLGLEEHDERQRTE